MPIETKEVIGAQLKKMKTVGIITPQTEPTSWLSSLTDHQKAYGSLRACPDPKDLNKAKMQGHYKVPTLGEIRDWLAGSMTYSKLDAKNGF